MYYTLNYLDEQGNVTKSADYSKLMDLANDINLDYNTCNRLYRIMSGLVERKRSSQKYEKLMKMFQIEQKLGFYKLS